MLLDLFKKKSLAKSMLLQLIRNYKQLLDRWAQEYVERLKPGLFVERFEFRNAESRYNWHSRLENDPLSKWGVHSFPPRTTLSVRTAVLRVGF